MKAPKFVLAATLALSMLSQGTWIHAEEPVPEEPEQIETIIEETEEPAEEIIEETVEEVTEVVEEKEEQPEDDRQEFEVVTDVNPFYKDFVSEEKLIQEYEETFEAGEASVLLDSSRNCASVNEAAVWMRGQMKARTTAVTVNVQLNKNTYSSAQNAFDTVWKQILDGAMAHTGNGTEGDYIKWHYSGASIGGSYRNLSTTYDMTMNFTISYHTSPSQETATTTAVNNLLNTLKIGKDWSDYDKIYKIFEWMTKNIVYAYGDEDDMYYHTALSAISNKRTVCQGYSSLLYRLALSVGLDCRVVAGDGSTSGSAPHGWNIVKIDGKWYNLDSTWDAGSSPSNWDYFLKAASPFGNDHRNWDEYKTSAWKSKYTVSSTDYSTAKLNKVKEFVKRLYTYCLNRTPDNGGLLNWAGLLQNKKRTAAQVVQGFFGGTEYQNRNRTDFSFISDCYRVMMNRAYDTGGMNNWLNTLEYDFVSRMYVVKGFVGSSEFNKICTDYGVTRGSITVSENRDKNIGITRFVVRLYQNVLDRDPDVGGLNSWTGMINNSSKKKSTAIQVAVDGFFHSKEFKNRGVSNSEYVNILYLTFLNREADSGGFNSWMRQLNSGTSRDTVLNGFANSQEFANLMAGYGIK